MRALALLGSASVAVLSLAALELTRAPAHARSAAAFAALVRAAASTWSGALLLFSLAAAALLWLERSDTRGSRVALALAGGAQGVLAWSVLAEHPSLTWHPLGFVVLAALVAGFVALHLGLAAARLRAAIAVGLALVLSGALVARLHYGVLVGGYLPAHAAALQLAFVSVTLGLALLTRPVAPRRLAPAACLLIGATAFVATLDLPAVAAARPALAASTELQRGASVARAVAEERAQLWPNEPASASSRRQGLSPDPEGARRFRAHSGMPALPEGFSLESHDVLLVLSDATRDDRSRRLPHLSRLASRSMRFSRAYSPSNGTFASLASMLSMVPFSLAELDVRPRFWRGRLREEQETAVEAMRAGGRATFWIGHDHRGCFSDHLLGLEQGFDTRTLLHQARGEATDADVDARIADAAVAEIRRLREAGERYFGLVFFVSPHDDYQSHGGPGASELERYDEELDFMDAQLARVLEAVDDQTVVIFAGDHGEAFGEHGARHHLGTLHEEEIHVPLVVHVPGVAPGVVEDPVSTSYVLPWLLAAGSEPEQARVREVLERDVGPMLRATEGAVLSEMIGPRVQQAALIGPQHTALYDVFAGLVRVYAAADTSQRTDLREREPALLERLSARALRYRHARFAAHRFRFRPAD